MQGEHFVYERVVDGVREFGVVSAEPSPEAQARADEIVAAYDRRQAELARRRAVSGLDAANEADEAAGTVLLRALNDLRDFLARTLPDLMAKAALIVSQEHDPEQVRAELAESDSFLEDLGLAVLLDLHAMAQGERA